LIELAAKESWEEAAYISMKGMQLLHLLKLETLKNKSDISYLKTSRAFDVQIHSRALLAAVACWLATL